MADTSGRGKPPVRRGVFGLVPWVKRKRSAARAAKETRRGAKRMGIDYLCMNCGKVTRGPHKGSKVAPSSTSIKGNPNVSHGLCGTCRKKMVKERKKLHGK